MHLTRRYPGGGADASAWDKTRKTSTVVAYGFTDADGVTAKALRAAAGQRGEVTAVCVARYPADGAARVKGYALLGFRQADTAQAMLQSTRGKLSVEGSGGRAVPLVLEYGRIEDWPCGLQEVAGDTLLVRGLDGAADGAAVAAALESCAAGSVGDCVVPSHTGRLCDYGVARLTSVAAAQEMKENHPLFLVKGRPATVEYIRWGGAARKDGTPFAERVAEYAAREAGDVKQGRAPASSQTKDEDDEDPFGAAFALLDQVEAGKEEAPPTPAPAPLVVEEEIVAAAAAPAPAPAESMEALLAAAKARVTATISAAPKPAAKAARKTKVLPADLQAKLEAQRQLLAKPPNADAPEGVPLPLAKAPDPLAASIQAKLDAQKALLARKTGLSAATPRFVDEGADAGRSRFAALPAEVRRSGFTDADDALPDPPTASRFGGSGFTDGDGAAQTSSGFTDEPPAAPGGIFGAEAAADSPPRSRWGAAPAEATTPQGDVFGGFGAAGSSRFSD
eukprot:TRINITY_DN2044_c0_g1_i1.p1 TRINITY_DN2044_c0_g1~~TRINITY_DN2044_c0_g1_i1.p1  ORF type:complete len:507 (+),score=138.29 TRINITY_DN2044_c0_g1_i1:1034-2554(+)